MKVALVEPIRSKISEQGDFYKRDSASVHSGSSISVREPVALGYIAAALETASHQTSVMQQNEISDYDLIDILCRYKPDLVGFSVLTYTNEHALELAKDLKKEIPSVKIVFGGYHPSGYPEIVRNPFIDFIVIGEGEETAVELADAIENNGNIHIIKGLAVSDGDKIKFTGRRQRLDFGRLPWPLRDKDILKYAKAAPMAYPSPPNQVAAAQISYSRGCPYACSFCPSDSVYGRTLSFRNPSEVVDEIFYLKEAFGTNFLFFNDLTFSSSKKKYMNLMSEMLARNVKINWFAMANAGMDEELAYAMAEAGCSRIGIGIESVIDERLAAIKPSQNYRTELSTLELFDNLGVLTRAYMMIGYPDEMPESLQTTLSTVKQLPIDQLRLGFVTPFPGTQFYERHKHRITRPFSEFTGDTPVMDMDYIARDDILAMRKEMIGSFYSSDEYLRRAVRKTRRFPRLRESFDYMFGYLHASGIIEENRFSGVSYE